MRLDFAVIAAALFAASFAAAQDPHDHSKAAAEPRHADKGMHGMHDHMLKMRQQMAQVRAAKDPKEKERLMNEHFKAMEESMSTMQGMMGCGKT